MNVLLEVLKKIFAVLKSLGEKSCEIKGGNQEMAATMLMIIMAVCIGVIPYQINQKKSDPFGFS